MTNVMINLNKVNVTLLLSQVTQNILCHTVTLTTLQTVRSIIADLFNISKYLPGPELNGKYKIEAARVTE